MLRLIGAAAAFGALSWCGFHRAAWYRRRVSCLAAWRRGVLEGERMLCDRGESTPAYLARLGEIPGLERMAGDCLARLEQEERLEPAWEKALADARLPLNEEERRAVAALGSVIGRYDPDHQRLALEEARQRLGTLLAAAEEERRRLCRMWPVLGVSAGALVVILFY